MQPLRRTAFVLTAWLALATSCLSTSSPTGPTTFGNGPRRILIIGNSLVGANNLGAMVATIAESAKVSPLPSVTVYWEPDFALIDHWNVGDVQSRITNGHYDVVLLQQGPSSVEVNRDTLRLAAKLFAPIIRAAGGTPGLLSVWPTIDRQADWDRATESYQLAARDVGGYMVPGGEVWRAAWRRNPELPFYSDGLHPNVTGSYAVALSIVSMLYQIPAVGLPPRIIIPGGYSLEFDAATVQLLQESADSAIQRYGIQPVR